jgi:hypothetical protein
MPGPDEDPTTKHKGIWWRLFFSGVWLVYLAYPVSRLFGHRHSAVYIAGGLALLAVFCVIYVYLLYEWDRLGVNPHGWLAAMAAVAVITSVVYDGGGAACLRRRRHDRRDRGRPLPVRGHGAQLPVRVHPEDRRP